MSFAGIGAFASMEERQRALRVGHDILVDSWPCVQRPCRVALRGQWNVPAQAAFRFPGVVRVTLRCSGELIAQSLPGKPLELDQSEALMRAYEGKA